MSPTISAGIRIGAELRPLRIGLDDHTTEATRRRDTSSFLDRGELRRSDVDRVFRRQGLHVPKSYLNGAALNRGSIGKSWTRNSTFCMHRVFPSPDIQIQSALADQRWGVIV